jgi:hypothetical protein
MAKKPEILENDDVKHDVSIEESTEVKGAIKEDLANLFGEELTEEFKEKVTTLFEAALADKVSIEAKRLEEEKAAEIEELKAELTEQVDTYMTYVVEQWMKENEVAIESSLKNDITEGFISGLKNLFVESYIEVPADKTDVVEELAGQVESLEADLNEAIAENVEMRKMINEAQMEAILDDVCEGLADTQTEKLKVLAEGISFEDADNYRKKLEIVKESYFADTKKTGTALVAEEQLAVDPDSEDGKAVLKSNDPNVNRYVDAISKSLKK